MGKCQYSDGCFLNTDINSDKDDTFLQIQNCIQRWNLVHSFSVETAKNNNRPWQQFWKTVACNNILGKKLTKEIWTSHELCSKFSIMISESLQTELWSSTCTKRIFPTFPSNPMSCQSIMLQYEMWSSNMMVAAVSSPSVSSGWTTPSWTSWGEKAFATSACSSATMTSTSSRGTSSTSSRRCRPSAAWPGTSVSNSTTRLSATQGTRRRSRGRSRCPGISEPHRSPFCPRPGPLTPPSPPVWDPRVGWPRPKNQSSRDRPHPPESPSRPRRSLPSLLTRPKRTRVRVCHWDQCTRDGRPQRSPRFRKAAANLRSSTSDASLKPAKDLCSC